MNMRIAHINLAKGYRGGERQAELLIRALSALELEQVLIARANCPLSERLVDADVEIRHCRGLLSAFRATRGVDVVHSHEGRGVYAAWLRKEVSGTPYVVTRRVNNPLGDSWLTRRAYTRASFVASVAADVARIVQTFDDRIRSCVIHSSSSGLPVDPATAKSIRDGFPGKWIIGNVGALDNAQKGQEYIIEVARRMQESHPEFQFLFVGGGDDEAMLRELGRDLPNVAFAGWVDNVGDYLAAFDLFILPSNKEGIGGILLDAMDRALPIIASRVGGLPEIVIDGENGILIDPRSPDQLERAILRLYDDPDLRRAMGARGKEFSRDFTADAMAAKYLELYKQATGDE
ncbi:MAG: glycosyltransferase [Gammaproteobacteria bacterium]|jgi:glycosyltransferase involved in cell wall biosynthesis|nr:glycosyltransferase [Gammaproteobacteria bacterium]